MVFDTLSSRHCGVIIFLCLVNGRFEGSFRMCSGFHGNPTSPRIGQRRSSVLLKLPTRTLCNAAAAAAALDIAYLLICTTQLGPWTVR